MVIKSLQLSIVALLVSAVAAWPSTPVGPARIQGVVTDSSKNPIAGAEVHITAKDGSGLQKIVRTDANGQFGASSLPVTDYEVVLFVNGQIKATLTNQHVFGNKPTQLDFKLTGKYVANAKKKHTHMVYVPAETGSNLSGRWVEVDDRTGAGAAGSESGEVSHISGAAVRQMQNNGSNSGGN
jgi:Carboxypeptidase regulatory-like domain